MFRRRKLADPRLPDAAAREHLRACPHCQRFSGFIDEGEIELAKALQVPVPDGLVDRVLLKIRTGRSIAPRVAALAASLMLAVGFGLSFWHYSGSENRNYAYLALKHNEDDPVLFLTAANTEPEFFRELLGRFGGELVALVDKPRFVEPCPLPDGTDWHVEFETGHARFTLILVPDQSLKARTQHARLGKWSALAQPIGGGYYVIVADSSEMLDAGNAFIRRHIRWRS